MTASREQMHRWGWSEEAIAWYLEDQGILAAMSERTRGYYEGVFDAIAYDNGAHENGLSRHRLPNHTVLNDEEPRFDYRKFLAVMGEIDDEGHIYLPGCTVVQTRYGRDVLLALHCTESVKHSEPEELTDVTWGYRESYRVWKEEYSS